MERALILHALHRGGNVGATALRHTTSLGRWPSGARTRVLRLDLWPPGTPATLRPAAGLGTTTQCLFDFGPRLKEKAVGGLHFPSRRHTDEVRARNDPSLA